ncbi:hypothetical protein EPUS_00071 [Endocarpon pusillum Z07020]|uniref:DUF292 domain protein n=1 Tax=Endocarpon pusillum (strain Z07020 / HMAS-L-300199) TaxID=1263415 RepID=U1I0A2_ENDPU|nr:uncharacterized protein EPUS_00071 [Endocarpon pusillum Z07020]ERF75279.1 hypothetical protein EPUS_00071 [Endocarpon pusillum Z07020]
MPSTSSQTSLPLPSPSEQSAITTNPLTPLPQLKLKSTLRLLIPRLRMAQKKDTAVSISSRREMSVLLSQNREASARIRVENIIQTDICVELMEILELKTTIAPALSGLLAQNREASARIRVENIIQTDICVELMEILELYAELLLARAALLDARDKNQKDNNSASIADSAIGPDTGLEEAAAAIIYAAPRLPREVRELGIVRGLLVERLGKEFALKANIEGGGGVVPKRVVEKLRVQPPGEELVEAYLREIARTYGVEWPKSQERERETEMGILANEVADEEEASQSRNPGADDDDGSSGGGGGDRITAALSTPIKPKSTHRAGPGTAFSREELTRATPPRDLAPQGAKSPISVAPPAPRSDNPSPKVKIPGGEETTTGSAPAAAAATKAKNVVVGGKIPDVDELAKRFRELKR